MPSLSDTLRSGALPGYMPVDAPAAPPIPPSETIPVKGTNRSLRSPLPPLAASFDNLRQFNEVGQTPRFRNMPLALSMSSPGGSVTNITQVTSTGSSGSSTSSTTLPSKTVTLNTAVIAPGNSQQSVLAMARSFQLLSITASLACEVRLYGTATAQSLDALRVTDQPVSAELGQGIITDVVFDTSPFTWEWQNRIAANADTSQTTNIYVTVVNTQGTSQAVTITIKYVPLQTT